MSDLSAAGDPTLPEASDRMVSRAAATWLAADSAEMVAAGMMIGVKGGSVTSAGMDNDVGTRMEVTYPPMLTGTTFPTSSDAMSCTDCGIFPAISVICSTGAVKMMVVVIICGGPTVTVARMGSGSCTTAVVTIPAKVKVMVVLSATMRLGRSATARRVAVERNNILISDFPTARER